MGAAPTPCGSAVAFAPASVSIRSSEHQSSRRANALGPICFVAPQDEGLPPAFGHQPYSEATSELIDAEVRRIVEASHHEADRLLAGHRDTLDALARALLTAESLNATEIREVAALTELPVPATVMPSASG